MALTIFMTMLCLAGVAFCVRFLVALDKECKARSTLLLAAPAYRLKPTHSPATVGTHNPVDRVARERVGRGPFSGTLGNSNRSEKGYF